MRGRMLADEALSDEDFERVAHRIALEAHEDRLQLWNTALQRYEQIERLEALIQRIECKLGRGWVEKLANHLTPSSG